MIADYVVVGSDSGRIVILEYIPSKNTFERVTKSFLLLTEQYALYKWITVLVESKEEMLEVISSQVYSDIYVAVNVIILLVSFFPTRRFLFWTS